MSERSEYPHGVPCWVDTAQPDPDRAVDFYGRLFGWEFSDPGPMPTEPPGKYYVARLGGKDVAGVSSMPAGMGGSAVWSMYVSVQSADATAQGAAGAGGKLLTAPFDAPPAGRMAVLADPSGAAFCVWEASDRTGSRLINEPNTWTMSVLHTDDVDSAKRFYNTLFGWETERFGPEITLWRRPGYVGGEPQQPVPRDVVAALAGLPPGAPPHWQVDFRVADADATAASAESLGGHLVAPPQDASGFRVTAVADPQGAVFSASALVMR